MTNLYIIASFSGHVKVEQMWTQIDQENGASEKFYMVLIAMQFGTICGKKFRIKSFLQPFRRREGSSFANILFLQSLV